MSASMPTHCRDNHRRRAVPWPGVLVAVLLAGFNTAAPGFTLEVERVTDRAYALVGDIGPRSVENHALNNTLGFVVTDDGVILVGSGASPAGAALIERTVAGVTPQPIRWVVNIGAQDHHWLGNDYFAAKGAEIIALERTVAAQQTHVDAHLARLRGLLGDVVEDIGPAYAPAPIDADRASLQLGGLDLELMWPGNGHFPGDAVLWLPRQRVVFTGDFVFHDRMLGIHPFTSVVAWRDAFDAIAALEPAHVVPGHGRPGDMAKATADTGDYLHSLADRVGGALEDWMEIGATIEALAEAPAFRHLRFYDDWHRRNLHRTYLQLESAL
ncbi:MAG: MBL fold metallo-hydrolase [Gammaproteobacteria bacterium]|nr:MBL fold metallo-hydrolase [Gammaproteobacteria bacterium]